MIRPRALPAPLSLAALLALLVVLSLAAAGCGDDEGESGAAGTTGTAEATQPPEAQQEAAEAQQKADGESERLPKVSNAKQLDQKPKVARPAGSPPDELVSEDLVAGEGPAAKAGDMVSVQYVGISWSSGKQFDASWDRGQPFEFPLGQGQVIQGWDRGVVGMKRGGRRLLVIPPALGYGAQGAPPDILPNETLVFVVDLERIG